MPHIHAKLSIRLREEVGAVKYQSGINGDSMRKLAQSKPFGLRRRYVGCIPAGCRTVILRNRMLNSNGQTANRERQLAAVLSKFIARGSSMP